MSRTGRKADWQPSKGGDGPLPSKVRRKTRRQRRREDPLLADVELPPRGGQPRNTDRYLTLAPPSACVETVCPFDRAHGVKGEDGRLVPAARARRRGRAGPPLPESRARLYPPSAMTSRGVSHDSAFDALYELQRELDGIDGIGASSVMTVAQAVHTALARKSPRAIRSVILGSDRPRR